MSALNNALAAMNATLDDEHTYSTADVNIIMEALRAYNDNLLADALNLRVAPGYEGAAIAIAQAWDAKAKRAMDICNLIDASEATATRGCGKG